MIHPLAIAASKQDIQMLELLLSYPVNMEHGAKGYTALMQASEKGDFVLVKRLVQAGAKVEAFAWGDPKCRADWLAEQGGHKEVAAWLRTQLPAAMQQEIVKTIAQRNIKFLELYEKNTIAPNYDLQTEDIDRVLTAWDTRFGIRITAVERNALQVIFQTLPEDLSVFVQEVYAFCPDTIDQHFGWLDDFLTALQESGQLFDPEVEKLITGVYFTQENFGEVLLMRHLQTTKMLSLWWD